MNIFTHRWDESLTGHSITFKKLAQCKNNSSMLFLETLNSVKRLNTNKLDERWETQWEINVLVPWNPCQRVQLYTSFFRWQESCNGKPRMSFIQWNYPEKVYSYWSLNCSLRCCDESLRGKTQDSAFLKKKRTTGGHISGGFRAIHLKSMDFVFKIYWGRVGKCIGCSRYMGMMWELSTLSFWSLKTVKISGRPDVYIWWRRQ